MAWRDQQLAAALEQRQPRRTLEVVGLVGAGVGIALGRCHRLDNYTDLMTLRLLDKLPVSHDRVLSINMKIHLSGNISSNVLIFITTPKQKTLSSLTNKTKLKGGFCRKFFQKSGTFYLFGAT